MKKVQWQVIGLLYAILFSVTIPAPAAAIPGRGTLSGTVTAPEPFQAAEVFASNAEMNIVFLVYTAGGKFRAVNLFPGTYEVWAEKSGFQGATKTVEIQPGENTAVDLSMTVGEAAAPQTGGMGMGAQQGSRQPVEQVDYDELFPEHPAREMLEETCIYCHGANFISNAPKSRDQWNRALARMTSEDQAETGYEGAMVPRSTYSEPQWESLLEYLTENFGPESRAPGREALRGCAASTG